MGPFWAASDCDEILVFLTENGQEMRDPDTHFLTISFLTYSVGVYVHLHAFPKLGLSFAQGCSTANVQPYAAIKGVLYAIDMLPIKLSNVGFIYRPQVTASLSAEVLSAASPNLLATCPFIAAP